MGPFFLLVCAASMALAAYVYRHQARQASLLHVEEWRDIAEAVGLTHFETSWTGVLEPTAVLTARSGVLRGELAEAAAQALGTTGRSEAEAPLLAALGHRDDAVELAATVALGRCGSAAAVPPLRRLESTSRDHACRRAAREAVAQIQSRLTGAKPGQLSLAAGESGQLSLAEDKAGQVTLLENDDNATPDEGGPGSQD